MKYLFLMLIFLFSFSGISQASEGFWYIINNKNFAVAKCEYQPDTADLESREEISVYSEVDLIVMEAEYRGGKIVQRVKSQAEKDEEIANDIEREEMRIINKIVIERAYKEAKKQGHTFTKMDKHVDDIEQVDIEIEEEKIFKEKLKVLVDK